MFLKLFIIHKSVALCYSSWDTIRNQRDAHTLLTADEMIFSSLSITHTPP